MLEGIIAIGGVLVFLPLFILATSQAVHTTRLDDPRITSDQVLGPFVWAGFSAVITIYFTVRFVHWAWETPIPFIGG